MLDDDQDHTGKDSRPAAPRDKNIPLPGEPLPPYQDQENRPEPEAGYRDDGRIPYQDEEWNGPYSDLTGAPPPSEIDPIIDEEEFEEPEEQGMGFFDHLEELRSRLIKSLLALAVTSALCGYFYKEIVENVLLAPAVRAKLTLINTEPMGQLTITLQVVIISGLIMAIPFIIWQFWGFVKPGLYQNERRYVSAIAIATIFCFLGGVAFAYFVMIPTSLDFIRSFILEGVTNTIAVSNYFSFILGFILACGVVFEMPILSYALSRFGIVTPVFLRKYRRHAIIIILILAAIITPTPDPINQMFMGVPLYILYEISILVSAAASRKRAEAIVEAIEDGEIKV
jgi:sec-independent protein translocase protein TatC